MNSLNWFLSWDDNDFSVFVRKNFNFTESLLSENYLIWVKARLKAMNVSEIQSPCLGKLLCIIELVVHGLQLTSTIFVQYMAG